jgi:cbb3-type cytochrome oxidase maturation protein
MHRIHKPAGLIRYGTADAGGDGTREPTPRCDLDATFVAHGARELLPFEDIRLMSVLYVLVVVALLMVIGAVVAFVWSVRHGQFDDLETPAVRMLHGDSDDRKE